MDIDYVDIILENCDVYRIPPEKVLSIILDDIHSGVLVNSVGQYIEDRIAGYSLIEIIWPSEYATENEKKHPYSKIDFLERMAIRDITGVCVVEKNGEKHEFYVVAKNRYGDGSSLNFENLWQQNVVLSDRISIEIKNRDADYGRRIDI